VTVAALPPFAVLLDLHGDELLAHARRLASRPTDAEDLLQEALLRALRAYPRLRHGDHLRAWLYRVLTTTAIDAHRATRPEVLVGEPPVDAAAPPDAADDGAFEALIAPLPEAARAVLHLRFVDDLDHDAIAARLGISPEAARQRVSTAVRTLRKEHVR